MSKTTNRQKRKLQLLFRIGVKHLNITEKLKEVKTFLKREDHSDYNSEMNSQHEKRSFVTTETEQRGQQKADFTQANGDEMQSGEWGERIMVYTKLSFA